MVWRTVLPVPVLASRVVAGALVHVDIRVRAEDLVEARRPDRLLRWLLRLIGHTTMVRPGERLDYTGCHHVSCHGVTAVTVCDTRKADKR